MGVNVTDIKMEEGRRQSVSVTTTSLDGDRSQSLLRRFQNSPSWRPRAPNPKSYPPISSIPTTSPERLALAAADHDPSTGPADKDSSTVLYLAYGSNLSAQTFLGMRGIRPVSQINVEAPAFDLTFDLPGIAYNEPCFANTKPRKIPKPPIPVPVPGKPPQLPPSAEESDSLLPPATKSLRRGPTWSKGLYGVVYEVTREDFATILRTEGGGRSYKDVLTACLALPPAIRVPEKPPIPELPKPFLAHTLYCPAPLFPPSEENDDIDRGDSDDDNDGDDRDPRKQPWLRRLLLPPYRTPPDYSEPSARYLKLIRDGAAEHALPDDYQAYLAELQPYTITTVRQQIGRILFLLLAVPIMLPMLALSRISGADRLPNWIGLVFTVAINLLWIAYDLFFLPLFGDGERTLPDKDDEMGKIIRRTRRAS
ncbi:hypothetical protein F5Y16DRAFT_387278 [Xylariaceae sp. FL0255]|nr:hypothetical protein F5Y16DRAFT_387278 [Xylariaceae sp. FL0255]